MSEYVTQKKVSELEMMLMGTDETCPKDNCKKNAHQHADISVPIKLKPEAVLGKIEMECCGEPKFECKKESHDKECEIVLIQKVCIKIPVRYKIEASAGKSFIQFDCCDQ